MTLSGKMKDLLKRIKTGRKVSKVNLESNLLTNNKKTIDFDGTVDETGRVVVGAVLDFFNDPTHPERYRQVTVTYHEGNWPGAGEWPSWLVRK